MIEHAKAIIEREGYNVYNLCENRQGTVTSCVLKPGPIRKNVFSVSKTFTATAVGMLVTRGALSVDDKVIDLLKRYIPAEHDPKLKDVEVRHLLTHSMGTETGYLFEDDRHTHGTDDWAALVLSSPLKYRPGEKLVYTNSGVYLLSLIVEEIAGQTLFDFLRQELLRPLRFTGYAAGTCPLGHTFGASEMFYGCDDMAKLGALYVNGGIYEGKRYLSEAYLAQATRRQIDGGDRGHGFGLWMNDDKACYADGAYGQLILIVPEKRTVLSMQTYETRLNMRAFVDELTHWPDRSNKA